MNIGTIANENALRAEKGNENNLERNSTDEKI